MNISSIFIFVMGSTIVKISLATSSLLKKTFAVSLLVGPYASGSGAVCCHVTKDLTQTSLLRLIKLLIQTKVLYELKIVK